MLLNMFRPLAVELVERQENQVVVRSPRRLCPGKLVTVLIAGSRTRIWVAMTRALPQGQFACIGELVESPELPDPEANHDAAFRRVPRSPVRMRVMSADLPGFTAVSVDFSTGGMQIEACGKVEVGQVIQLRLFLENHCQKVAAVYGQDDAGREPFRCLARVAWSADRGRGRYAMGLQFQDLSQSECRALTQFQRYLQSRARESMLDRLLGLSS